MKFVQRDLGDAAEVSSGGGARGMRKEIVSLLLLTAGAMVAIYFSVAGITELVVRNLSPEKEQQLFSLAGNFGDSAEIPDQLDEKFTLCETVLAKLEKNAEVPQIEYSLIFLDDLSPNAFAIPGGKIAVTRGLLNSLDEEIAIAFVLAHELGHFAQRDHLRGLGRKLGFSVCLQILFGGDIDPITSNATNLMFSKYSRDQEAGADDFGVRCVLATYGESKGAEKLFEILEEENSLPPWAYMFSTHPDNQSRIRRVLDAGTGD